MRYVVLLRGVNAGGKRRVPKDEFKAVLESLGFTDIVIYINSGNAIFSSPQPPKSNDVQAALENHFGFDIATLILDSNKIQSIAAAIPSDWTNDALTPEKFGQKSDVIYLFPEVNSPKTLDRLGYNPDIESMRYISGAIICTVSRQNQMRGSLAKNLLGTSLYQKVTVRNVNTARKLAELCGE